MKKDLHVEKSKLHEENQRKVKYSVEVRKIEQKKDEVRRIKVEDPGMLMPSELNTARSSFKASFLNTTANSKISDGRHLNFACSGCGGFYCPVCKSTVPPQYRMP